MRRLGERLLASLRVSVGAGNLGWLFDAILRITLLDLVLDSGWSTAVSASQILYLCRGAQCSFVLRLTRVGIGFR